MASLNDEISTLPQHIDMLKVEQENIEAFTSDHIQVRKRTKLGKIESQQIPSN